jgi:hypothetical protein
MVADYARLMMMPDASAPLDFACGKDRLTL